jgi:hypothetical protein
MTSMPIITDQMVEDFRPTGKRRASYSTTWSSRLLSRGSRVVPQQQNPASESTAYNVAIHVHFQVCGAATGTPIETR